MSADYKSLEEILQVIIKKQNLDKVLELYDLKERFNEIVGDQIAKQVKIEKFEKGILTLEVESSAWKNEIFLLREKIIEKINQSFSKKIIQQIIIH